MDKILKCLEQCRLYNFNSRKGIKKILNIPEDFDMDNVKDSLNNCYSFFYIKKPEKMKKENKKETREEKYARYLSIREPNDIFDYRPEDYNRNKYRMLININELWLKKALKKINKLITLSLIEKNKNSIDYPIEYLHSSLKKRSYTTNVNAHKENKYLLAIDIQNFYPSISFNKIFNFFKYDLSLKNDIALIYATLCTCPLDDPIIGEVDYGLGQGLATSPILAYLSNYRMFEYIYKFALANNIKMTVYVDDIVFSSKKPIKQEFVNALFGIVKRNNLNIKKSKVKIYGSNDNKKITGICLTSKGKVRVPKSKHEEVKVQYDYLSKKIFDIKNIDEYFDFYNLFIKFKGNIEFIKLVEGKATSKHINFINEYKDYFLYGKKKKKRSNIYSKNNINIDDYRKFLEKYKKLKGDIAKNFIK